MKLRYLHLSDLHIGYTNMRGDNWHLNAFNQDLVITSLLEAIKEIINGVEYFDFIIISGDLARKGKKEEYDVASIFCKKLLSVTNLSSEKLYIVPGNHDIDREMIKEIHVRGFYKFKSQDDITEIIADSDFSKILKRKFNNFENFLERALIRRIFDYKNYHFVDTLSITKSEQNIFVNIVGLNSGLFSGYDGDDNKKLAIGLFQVEKALNQLKNDAILSIAFFHHPFECFSIVDKVCKNLLIKKMDLILTGHYHANFSSIVISPLGGCLLLSAGASFETRESSNSFNIVEIETNTGEGKVNFYKYLPQYNLWKVDTDINPSQVDGHFPFTIESIKSNNLKSCTTQCKIEIHSRVNESHQRETKVRFIHDFLLPSKYTGRVDEFSRIINVVDGNTDFVTNQKASLITICGLGGSGKSCLIRNFVENYKGSNRFEYIIWYSFYEARTEDEGYFFKKILEVIGTDYEQIEKDYIGIKRTVCLREALVKHLDNIPILLVLDGLEVIQNTEIKETKTYGHIVKFYNEVKKTLMHICNQSNSSAVVTSRVTMSEFVGLSGYLEIDLNLLTLQDSAELLRNIGLKGSNEELQKCANIFAGHPLCIMAAGKYMSMKYIEASNIEELVDDITIFKNSSEGEKLTKVINAYRSDLTEEQQYFLKMLSLHPRSVAFKNLPVLIKDLTNNDFANKEKMSLIIDRVINPLKQKNLIEELRDDNGGVTFNAHHLMKLAFSSWFDEKWEKRSHELWADAIIASPDVSQSATSLTSIEELQPYLDIIRHYHNSGNYKESWDVYFQRDVALVLRNMGFMHLLFFLSILFEKVIETGDFGLSSKHKIFLYECLSMATWALKQFKNSIFFRKKQFTAALEYSDKSMIIMNGAILAENYIELGLVNDACSVFNQFKSLNEYLYGGKVVNSKIVLDDRETIITKYMHMKGAPIEIYRWVFSKIFLYKGEYSKAQQMIDFKPEFLTEYNQIEMSIDKAEIHIRNEDYHTASRLLNSAIAKCDYKNYNTLKAKAIEIFILFYLKRGDLLKANTYNHMLKTTKESLDLPFDHNPFLFALEGEYEKALHIASKMIESAKKEEVNKLIEIESALVRCFVAYRRGKNQVVNMLIKETELLMQESDCWREKDRLMCIKKLLTI